MDEFERFIINLNEDKIKEKYTSQMCCSCNKNCKSRDIESNIKCIKTKWDTYRTDWEQGFDSDCFCHCCQHDICSKIIYYDKECHNKGHMDLIIIEL